MGSISMPLAIDSLGGGHTLPRMHVGALACTNTHTDDLHRINFKKPGMHRPQAGMCLV